MKPHPRNTLAGVVSHLRESMAELDAAFKAAPKTGAVWFICGADMRDQLCVTDTGIALQRVNDESNVLYWTKRNAEKEAQKLRASGIKVDTAEQRAWIMYQICTMRGILTSLGEKT